MTEMVQKGSGVYLNLRVTPKDKDYPPIRVETLIKKHETNQTCANPSFAPLKLSSTQCELITRYIQNEFEVEVEIEQPQGELAFTYDEKEPEEEE